jgi:peptidoglycan L-alanyl-D-glutamate endopeptidase CwlK
MDAVSTARLVGLHPVLVLRYIQLDQACDADGIYLRITQGLRTSAQQDALYTMGRTVPGKIVTEARGGYSAHNFGYALDAVPNDATVPNWEPDWNSIDPRWNKVLSLASQCGLAEGAQWRTFPDAPHFYLQECPATPTDAMRSALAQGGMKAVWDMIDQWLGKVPNAVPGLSTDITS